MTNCTTNDKYEEKYEKELTTDALGDLEYIYEEKLNADDICKYEEKYEKELTTKILEKIKECKTEDIKYNAKSDNGKLQLTLVPTEIIRDIAKVRMYGNQKYHAPYNWIMVEKERYKDAMLRHLLAYLDDENSIDEESGLLHIQHLACNIAFLCEMKRDDWDRIKFKLLHRDPETMKVYNEYKEEL